MIVALNQAQIMRQQLKDEQRGTMSLLLRHLTSLRQQATRRPSQRPSKHTWASS
jgi:hypothetical protein